MPRTIDADAIIDKVLRHYTEQEKNGNFTFVACEIKQNFADMITDAPTIDPAPQWIPVTERLPEEGKKVLTLDKWGHIHDRSLYKHMHGVTVFRPDGLSPGKDITHWMPLPEPPEDGGAENA